MKKMLQKIFSILLAACFVLSVVPAPAAAAETTTTNGQYSNGTWSEGGTGSITYDNGITLSKTAKSLGDNKFEITLQVQTSQTTSTVTNGGAVVLVMDVSGSMAFCADCGGEYGHDRGCPKSGSRMAAAKTAAKNFLASYAGTDVSASRMLAIVTFATGYSTKLEWVNVAGGAGKNSYNAAVDAIDSLSANGGTNLEGGLYQASTLLDSASGTKSVVLLTDGVPTYRINGGNGSDGSEANNTAAANCASQIKGKGADLYTVCFGVADELTYEANPWYGIFSDGPTVGEFLSGQVASSGCAYNADNSAELYAAFAAITESITSGLKGEGLEVTDPMADMITVINAGDNFASDGNGTYKWTLSNAQTSTNGNTTTYTYTYTYTVELNVQGQNFEEGKFFPTNKETYLTLADGSKLAFPVPGVTGTLPRTSISVTKVWDDANNQDGIRPESVTVQLTKDGKAVEGYEAVELNEANGWSYTWTGLIKQSKGAYHNYSVVELDLTEDYTYTATNTANGEETITLTNTHVPAVVSKTVTKVWNDADNQDGKRPDSISVVLKADGAEKATVELNAANNWSYTWENLPEKAAGKVINYTVDEVEVPAGYDKTVNGLTITNSYTPETTKVEGTKTWDDDNNRDNVRPESITINLLADGKQVASQEVTGEGNTWTFAFENLPKYRDGGVEIVYTITEDAVEGYEATVSGYNVTNKHEIETTKVEGSKTWNDNDNQDGKRPASITIHLLADGTEVAKKTVTANDGWKWSFTNLPKNNAGVAIVYTITEDAVAEYTSKVEGYNVTNTHTPETITISGTKTWDDADNQDGLRPEQIQLLLKANGVEIASITVKASDEWKYTVSDLAKYAGGQEIEYTVEEVTVNGYETVVDGYDITNKHTPATTEITVTKVWEDENNLEGFRPDSVTVILLADREEVGTIDLSEENKWTHTFENLPENAAGEDIVYTVKELEVEHYDVEITGSETDGFTITNTHEVEYISVEVTKEWDDNSDRDGLRPDEIKLTLLANGQAVGEAVSVTGEGDTWKHTFDKLPKHADGEEIVYSVTEETVAEYETEISEIKDGKITITNTHNPEVTDIVITKEWVDADDQDGLRPNSIKVTLYANGTEWKTVELKKNNDWTYTFEGMFVNSAGEAITYTVKEEAVDGYTAEIAASETGFAITNTHEVEKTEISVEKVWDDMENQDGIRPASITIKLLAGKEVVKEADLNEENKWSYTFTDLDVNAAGKEIKYSVEEVKVDGYKSKVTGSAEEGFIVTNTHTPETIDEIKVTKVWDDADNQDGIRPEKVTVNLLGNGKVVETVELKATIRSFFTGDWTATFKDLDKYENGEEIVYTITENAVSGYETKITGSVENGFTVTNTHEPEMTKLDVQKFWKDDNNKEKTRADSVKITLYANGKSTGKTVTLNEKNQWFDSFENLPKYDNGKEIKYTVKEASLALYKASYSYNGTKAVVTNTLSEVPNTGDTSNVGLYLGLMGVCAVAAVALILLNKKKRNA